MRDYSRMGELPMVQTDCLILMGAGGLLILLGLLAIIWDRVEKRSYYDSIAGHSDAREFLEHEPGRPELGALKLGGWLSISIGLLLLVMGVAFWIWG